MKNILLLFSQQAIARAAAEPAKLTDLLDRQLQNTASDIMRTHYAVYDDLVHIITNKDAAIIDASSGKDIAEYDLVYQRRWQDLPDQAKACATYLTKKTVPNIDHEAYVTASKNKLTQMWQLWEAGLSIPATIYASGGAGLKWIQNNLEQLPFGFPMVVKGVSATRGQDNYLAKNVNELNKLFTDNPDTAFLMQEFIPNDGDYRILVCGKEAKLAMYRQATDGKHTNNTSQGGQASLVAISDIAPTIIKDCILAAKVFNRDFAGTPTISVSGKSTRSARPTIAFSFLGLSAM